MDEISNLNNIITFGNYSLNIQGFTQNLTDGFHQLVVGSLKSNSEGTNLKNILLKPIISRSAFKSNSKKINTLYELKIPTVSIIGDYSEAIRDKDFEFRIEKLELADIESTIYTDATIGSNEQYKPILSEIIKAIELPFHVAEIRIKDSKFKFELLAEKRNDTGVINFDNIDVVITNIGNFKKDFQQNLFMKCSLQSLFMKTSTLDLDLKFDMESNDSKYTYAGNLGSMDLTIVNRMLEDLTAMSIKKGQLDKISFEVEANKYESTGTMDFYYQNIKMKYDEERGNGLVDPLKLFVNKMVLRQNNREDRHPKKGTIKTKRNPNRSMFIQIWEAVFDGIKSVLIPGKF